MTDGSPVRSERKVIGDPVTIADVARPRLDSVDQLRGLVMVLMVLDHVRDYFQIARINPNDPASAGAGLFLTRWVTHFCAPVFVALAGSSIFLARSRGGSRHDQAVFLLTRGLWLLLLEVTLVKLEMTFNLSYRMVLLQVIWAIGLSMIAMSVMIFLPVPVVGALGLTFVAGHNLLGTAALGPLGSWAGLFRPRPISGPWFGAFLAYPPVPWFGVLACGYGFGPALLLPPRRRRAVLVGAGMALILAFVALRWSNGYGEPKKWTAATTPTITVLSFLNCTKYPPSLLFVLMTLGPATLALVWFDGTPGWLGRRLIVFGRVPLFFYLLQWPLAHGLGVLLAWGLGRPGGWYFAGAPFNAPVGYGYGLPVVYLIWAVVVASLYPLSRWYAGVKRRSREPWLSYL